MNSDFEAAIAKFESLWAKGLPPDLGQFLRSEVPDISGDDFEQLLRELVKVDLELRWKRVSLGDGLVTRKQLEEYCREFPALLATKDLIGEEYRVRQRWGDRPEAADYVARFPEFGPLLLDDLRQFQRGQAKAIEATSREGAVDQTNADNSRVDEQLPTTWQRYHLVRPVGAGAFGRVYLAHDPILQRDVALKILSDTSHQTPQQQFTEAILASRVAHPSVVTIFDVIQAHERTAIVMEYVSGGDWNHWLASPQFQWNAALTILADVAEALHYAHRQNVYHCDVKPANILIGEDGRPKVADFGIAITVERQREHAWQTVGTPAYMAPEQVRGEAHWLDGRTDIWALGVMLYELLSGQRPFQGRTISETFDEILFREPRALRQLNDSLDPAFEDIIQRCLAKRIADRFSTCGDLALALRKLADVSGQVTPRHHASPGGPASPGDRGHRGGLGFQEQGDQGRDEMVHASEVSLPACEPMCGRDRELAEVTRLLRSPMTWLVTITGMGGLGKTTLAVHAANQLKDEFESLWFVDLARVTTARELLQTVALVIGLALEDNVDDESRLTRRITQRLRGRGPCLLLLDNLEQLVSPVETFLARWREELPNVSILATSRTRLGLPAERVFEIAALPVPLESQEADAEIDASPSVELFVRTARKSDAGFSVARDNRVAVAQICASLDGIPLAIELAASRISVLAPAQILDRLKRQTDVLSTSSGAVPARHRTLREAVQWSLNLLNADEKHAIVALSSLPGGCFPELGETVVSRIGTHRSPLDLLQQLRGHSLLRSQATPYGNRLTFYEIVRKTVRDSGGGPADVTRAGLENIVADALIEYVESWQRRLVGPESKEAMDRLMLERENLLAIQDAAVTSRNWTLAARTLLVISDALRERGLLHTLTNRLEIPLASLSTEVRVRFQSVRAAYFLATGNWPAALREAQQAVSDAATLAGDSEQNPRGRSLYQLLTVLISSADYAEAQQLLPQAIDDSTQAVDLPTIVRLLMLQGHLADRAGDGVKASESYRRAQEIAVPLGDRGLMAELDRRQGNLATRQGRLSEAAEYFQRSAAIADELGYARHRHLAFTSLGVVHCEQECFEDAIKAFDAAQNLAERVGDRRAIAVNEGNRGIALAGLGDHIAAIQSYLRAELINQELGNPLAVALNRGNRALSLAALDDVESSRCLLDEAAQTAAEHGDATNAVLLEGDRGLLLLRNRQFEPALRRLETSCEQLKGLSLHETKSAIPVLLGIAKCHFELGDLQQATYVLESVTKLTNRLGLKRGCRHAILGDCEVVARQLTEALKLG